SARVLRRLAPRAGEERDDVDRRHWHPPRPTVRLEPPRGSPLRDGRGGRGAGRAEVGARARRRQEDADRTLWVRGGAQDAEALDVCAVEGERRLRRSWRPP